MSDQIGYENERSKLSEKLNIMVVVCHPADAIDGAGGTLCLHTERGDVVTVVVCTHGVDTHDWRRHDDVTFHRGSEVSAIPVSLGHKEAEVVDGLEILGVRDVRFLRFPDRLLNVSVELIEAIAHQMADIQPHLLVLHNPTEEGGFGDVGHADSAIAALKARYLAGTHDFLKNPSGRRFPAQIFFMIMNGQTTALSGNLFGNVLVDITPVVDRKVRAMDCLRSQYYPGDPARKVIEDVNGRMGLHWSMPYAEAFQTLYPEGYSRLPANEYLMELANTSMEDVMACQRIAVMDSDKSNN